MGHDDEIDPKDERWATEAGLSLIEAREMFRGLPERTRLAVTAWVFNRLRLNQRVGGTYRYLIYDVLGFDPVGTLDVYRVLHAAGALYINNDLSSMDAHRQSPNDLGQQDDA